MLFDVFKHQEVFVKSKEKFPALVAGYGSGKTFAFCLKAILECGRNPGKIILLAEPTYPMVRDVLQPTLENILHQIKFDFSYRASQYKYKIFWKDGHASIILRSAENWRRWAGLNLAAFGIDEAALLKDDQAWKMGISRLRDGNHLTGFTTTTPEGFNWHYTNWKDEPRKGYKLFHGKTTDNRFLPDEFVETLLNNYDTRLVKAYLNGEYVNLQQGQAYYNFDRNKNVKKVEYNPSKNIRFALDFNVDPMCGVVIQVYDTDPKIRVLDEIRISHGGRGELMTERMIRKLKAKYPKAQFSPTDLKQVNPIRNNYICYPDPAGKQRRTQARFTDHDIIRREGVMIRVKKMAPRVTDRLNSVNNSFQTMVIDPKCKYLIKDFEQVAVKEGTREINKTDNPNLTHMSDAIGYFIDYEFPVRKPVTKTFMS
jgi:phage terminase large subunit